MGTGDGRASEEAGCVSCWSGVCGAAGGSDEVVVVDVAVGGEDQSQPMVQYGTNCAFGVR